MEHVSTVAETVARQIEKAARRASICQGARIYSDEALRSRIHQLYTHRAGSARREALPLLLARRV